MSPDALPHNSVHGLLIATDACKGHPIQSHKTHTGSREANEETLLPCHTGGNMGKTWKNDPFVLDDVCPGGRFHRRHHHQVSYRLSVRFMAYGSSTWRRRHPDASIRLPLSCIPMFRGASPFLILLLLLDGRCGSGLHPAGNGEGGPESGGGGGEVPWVEILSPRPAQLLEDGTFDSVDLSFIVHGAEMGEQSAAAEVYILRYWSCKPLEAFGRFTIDRRTRPMCTESREEEEGRNLRRNQAKKHAQTCTPQTHAFFPPFGARATS